VTPADRAAALSLLERAKQNADMHIQGTPSFKLTVAFTAQGAVGYTGPGELTESWISGRSWRWTASLGDYSQVRIGSNGMTFDVQPVDVVPLRVQMLRGAIFAPIRLTGSAAMIRTAAAQLNSRPVTCILLSHMPAPANQVPGRLWEETEYCVDNASGLLQIYSEAPGTYIVYSYSRNLQFHGRVIPDQIAGYVGGAQVLTAQLSIEDLGSVDQADFTPSNAMRARGPVPEMMYGMRFPMRASGPASTSAVSPVIVHATINAEGNVIEEELSAAAEPSLAQQALALVKQNHYNNGVPSQREAYINVRFFGAN